MTSELKPCPFCGDSKHLIIDDYHDPEMDGYFGFNVICNAAGWDGVERGCGASGAWGETEEEAARIWNTRAVPGVPELVRYGLVLTLRGIPDIEVHHSGELVLHSQAAAIIAAEQHKTKDAEELAFRMDRFAKKYLRHMKNAEQRAEVAEAERDATRDDRFDGLWRFWNDKARELSQRNIALEAELAQIKAQVPVGYRKALSDIDGHFTYSNKNLGGDWQPLYAAPVDQTAEIERLREALKVQREAAATYCWERYKNRPPLDLSDAACFTSHEWQKVGDAMDAAVAVLSGKEPS